MVVVHRIVFERRAGCPFTSSPLAASGCRRLRNSATNIMHCIGEAFSSAKARRLSSTDCSAAVICAETGQGVALSCRNPAAGASLAFRVQGGGNGRIPTKCAVGGVGNDGGGLIEG